MVFTVGGVLNVASLEDKSFRLDDFANAKLASPHPLLISELEEEVVITVSVTWTQENLFYK